MLENISEPYADRLLQSVKARNEQMQQQMQQQGVGVQQPLGQET